jgi:transposase-like protein
MEHDFVYCPRCTRYAIFRWVRGHGQWECEDCLYKLPREEATACATTVTSAS